MQSACAEFKRLNICCNLTRHCSDRKTNADRVKRIADLRKKTPCLAVRRETINPWERRAPLAPKHVRLLSKAGVRVLVQPSNRRAYPMQEYVNAGAVSSEDISSADLIMSVKNVPVDDLIPGKTYVFFSHTIKAQKDNMPLLDAVLHKNIRLIDYEKMMDDTGRRIVMFGKWAGYAGMINILHGLGLRLLALGHNTPFLHVGLAHSYRDSHMAQNAVRDAGYEIALGCMPRSLGPLTFVFTGSGNVSQGAQEIFKSLPAEYVDVSNLAKVSQHGNLNKVYGCVVSRDDHLKRIEGGTFDADEFDAYPERYRSTFASEVAPYTSVLINGMYWAPNAPRLITLPDAKMLMRSRTSWDGGGAGVPGRPRLPHRLVAICDISADPGGSLEFMTECTTIDRPFCIYDANQNRSHDSFALPTGILVCSIDNMPAQMPLEATEYFGDLLLKYVWQMLESDASTSFEEFNASQTVKNAVIASNGQLTPNFQYIAGLRRQKLMASGGKGSRASTGAERHVLLLGAGFVSGPVVEYLSRQPTDNIRLTVATQDVAQVDKLVEKAPGTNVEVLDVFQHSEKLHKLVASSDLVISLLPHQLHPAIARLCIRHKSNMLTASYLSDEMRNMQEKAEEAGVTMVSEVGLDPGIDHMLAMEIIDAARERGGKITSFVSWCGGLPAPEYSDTPLRYKFSWSPRNVLLNALSPAKYLLDGRVVEVAAGELLRHPLAVDFLPGFHLQGFPNRDSLSYAQLYQLDQPTTLFRGTLRYAGFGAAMQSFLALGLVDPRPHPAFDPDSGPDFTWKELLAALVNLRPDVFVETLKSKVAEKFGGFDSLQYKTLEALDMLDDKHIVAKKKTPLDTLSNHLVQRLSFENNEKDLCLMHLDVKVLWPNGSEEVHRVNLVKYGEVGGFSAMASTVGYCTGITAKMILDGEIQRKGNVLPMTRDIYKPVLDRLAQEGITVRRSKSVVNAGVLDHHTLNVNETMLRYK